MGLMRSLSGRLLVLTIIFVMLAEVLIFIPSLARYRIDYLYERLAAANVAAIALLEADTRPSGATFERRLLASAEVRSIAVKRDAVREPVLHGDWRDPVSKTYDLDNAGVIAKVVDALMAMAPTPSDRVIRVIGTPEPARALMGGAIEITLSANQLREAMLAFGLRVFILSLVISLLTAALVFLSLNRWLVRPIRNLINNMIDFRRAPEASAIITPETGRTEIAEAQRELATMQTELRASLKQKTRLAALGEAVAKINHDLRNMLAVAQLLADRLERSGDPMVVKTAPKLLRSLDRATALCQQTLTFGSADEPAPIRRRVMLAKLAEEVQDAIAPDDIGPRKVEIDIAANVYAEADPDQLYRVLQNLARNAEQAMTASGKGSLIQIAARRIEGGTEIDVGDDGPGMPVSARENLFKAFKGGARPGGTGLGLHISRELVRGHGGELELIESSTEGTTFRITLPDTGGLA